MDTQEREIVAKLNADVEELRRLIYGLFADLHGLTERWRKLGNDSRSIVIPGKPEGQPTASGASLLVCADQLEELLK